MNKPKSLRTMITRSILVVVALLLVVFSGSVLAYSSNDDNTSDKKFDKSRETAKLRLEGTKLKACENREKAINNILDRIAKRGERRLDVYSAIFNRVQEFYEKKGLSVSNYDTLVADVNAKNVDFKCDGSDPKGAAASFKDDLKVQIKALQAYKQSIKNLIMAIKTSLSESSQSNSGGVGEQ